MSGDESMDLLEAHLREAPAFRALLRAVESRFYDDLLFPRPILDVGCGDGSFASVTFNEAIDVGFDPSWRSLVEAKGHAAYRMLVQADGVHMPFADGQFGSAFSNSVLEHIPAVEAVLQEVSRVLRPGAPFYFCVPSDQFLSFLSVGRMLDAIHVHCLARKYRRFFNRVSRHYHSDDAETWDARLEKAGLSIDRWWTYFSMEAVSALEWGHYLGLASLIAKRLTGRWIVGPEDFYLRVTDHLLRRYYGEPLPKVGGYLFFVAHKR